MAYVEQRKSDGKRRGRFKIPGRKSHGSTEWMKAPERAVQRLADDEEAKARQQGASYVDPRREKEPFGEWAREWMAAQTKAGRTVERRWFLLEKLIFPRWEHTELGQVTWFDAVAWADGVTSHDRSTVRHALSLMSTILTAAVDARRLHMNPLFRRRWHTRSAAQTRKKRPLAQPSQAFAIAERCPSPADQLMVKTAQFTGMRWGELAGLHRGNCLADFALPHDSSGAVFSVLLIDPEVGSLHEEEDRSGNGPRVRLFLGEPKPPNGARAVFVPQGLADELRKHLESWPHDYVFCTPRGKWWRRGNWNDDVLKPAADGRAALPPRAADAAPWLRIAADLADRIRTGVLPPGDPLPALPEQARRYGVSRATVQRAVDLLADQGALSARRGRRTTVAAVLPAEFGPPAPVSTEAWDPIVPGWRLHCGRHWYKTMMQEGDERGPIPEVLQCAQLGHEYGGVEGVYTHVTPGMVRRLLKLAQRRWDEGQYSQDRLPIFSQRVEEREGRRIHKKLRRRSG